MTSAHPAVDASSVRRVAYVFDLDADALEWQQTGETLVVTLPDTGHSPGALLDMLRGSFPTEASVVLLERFPSVRALSDAAEIAANRTPVEAAPEIARLRRRYRHGIAYAVAGWFASGWVVDLLGGPSLVDLVGR